MPTQEPIISVMLAVSDTSVAVEWYSAHWVQRYFGVGDQWQA